MSDEIQTTTPTEEKQGLINKPSAKVYISEDEIKALEAKIVSSKTTDEKAVYSKAVAEVREELRLAERAALEEQAKQEHNKLLEEMKREIESLKTAAPAGQRKSIPASSESPFKKTPDGKIAVPVRVIEEATRKKFFSQ